MFARHRGSVWVSGFFLVRKPRGGKKIRVSSLLLKWFPPNYNDGALGEWRTLEALHSCPALPPPSHDCILTLLPQQPSAEDTHTETHTATHKCTHLNTKPVAHTKQVFILLDVSMLSMFLHLCVCVYRCVYVCVNPGISSLERVTNHKHSSLSLSIFFSSSLLLY